MMPGFKDQCDVCGKFDFCKGSKGLVLCEKCISKAATRNKPEQDKKQQDDGLVNIKGQTNIFDYI